MNRIPPNLSDLPAFVASMQRGWGDPDRSVPRDEARNASTAEHRRLLSERFPGDTLVVHAGEPVRRNDDNFFPFRPDSAFVWATGCPAPGAVLMLTPSGSGHDATLFVPPPLRPGDDGFFSDRDRSELWVGASPGIAEWSAALEMEVRPIAELLPARAAGGSRVRSAGAVAGSSTDEELSVALSELRMVKDAWEIAEMRRAIDATVEGFGAVAAALPEAVRGGGERWLKGTFDRVAGLLGNGTGYATIAASGSDAAVLHWTRATAPVREGELLLLDAGVETRGFYTADVTRTFPVSGEFSAEQRLAHDLVQRAHEAGIAAVRPGAGFSEFHFAAMEVIASGLHEWGLLPVSVDEALAPGGQHHRRYLVCGIGHHLGLDVHDCSRASEEHYHGASLAPGMVLTVEPGLYFHAHDLTVPPELRGIGVRIEDDLLVTDSGAENLSEALPRDASGLEAWVRRRAVVAVGSEGEYDS